MMPLQNEPFQGKQAGAANTFDGDTFLNFLGNNNQR